MVRLTGREAGLRLLCHSRALASQARTQPPMSIPRPPPQRTVGMIRKGYIYTVLSKVLGVKNLQ